MNPVALTTFSGGLFTVGKGSLAYKAHIWSRRNYLLSGEYDYISHSPKTENKVCYLKLNCIYFTHRETILMLC